MHITRLIVALSLTGCLTDTLENAPCNSDADCPDALTCVRTEHQLATMDVGFCRSDGACARGVQIGCAVPDDGSGCRDSLTAVCTAEEDCFCCGVDVVDVAGLFGDPVLTVANVADDLSSARCVVCDTGLCDLDQEACAEGDDRCEVVEGICGCRVPEAALENSACLDDAFCGSDFVCARTLEQQEEPATAESLEAGRVEEPGACRPADDPGCSPGHQDGCKIESVEAPCPGILDADGYPNSQVTCDAAGRCFCCQAETAWIEGVPTAAMIYAVADDGSSAACVDCPTTPCDANASACTSLTHADCALHDGVCGCISE